MSSHAVGALVLLIFLGAAGAAHAALVNSHPSRLREMQEQGIPGAGLAMAVAADATRLLVSLRAFRTVLRVAALGLMMAIAFPIWRFDGGISVSLFLVTIFAVALVLGFVELICENAVLRTPERWALRLAPVAAAIIALVGPLRWLVLRLSGWVAGSGRRGGHPLVTEEQIMTLVDAGEEGGAIEQEEKDMIYSIFQLGDTLAREIMVPRIDMLAIETSTSIAQATDILLEAGHSRAPVYSGTRDNVIGTIYSKDLLAAWRKAEQSQAVGHVLREAYFVPEAKKVDELFAEMQVNRVHMAVVVDEYGGTAGIVTIEDIVEEIMGEIRDEYDAAEEMAFQQVHEGEFIFAGGIDLDDVNQLTGASLPKVTSETLGGFIYDQLGRVPTPGEDVEAGGLRLIVEQVSGRRIRKVRAIRVTTSTQESDQDGNHRPVA